MEIYETISHVSTNQVWLHINFASSRVYFKPSSLLGKVAAQLTRSYLPRYLAPLSPLLSNISVSLPHSCPPSPFLSSLLSSYPRVHATVNPLSLLFFGIVSLNHPLPNYHHAEEHRGAFLIAPRYV